MWSNTSLWDYLATWMDLFSRKIVGWQVADSMTAELVIEALKKAIHRQKRDFCPLCFLFKKAPGKLRSLLFKNPDLLGHSAIRQAVLEVDGHCLAVG
ncbi:MAG TPA: DDE-type integrase/transposase/recombinase [Blastocatellia bacterium]|nr:DDE-type integrase/transposase/recombinase [Blastocatellia bacterium]